MLPLSARERSLTFCKAERGEVDFPARKNDRSAFFHREAGNRPGASSNASFGKITRYKETLMKPFPRTYASWICPLLEIPIGHSTVSEPFDSPILTLPLETHDRERREQPAWPRE